MKKFFLLISRFYGQKVQKNKALVIYFISIGIIFFFFVFLVSVNVIGYSVKEKCLLAQEKYEGECVGALVSYVVDENNSFESRNSAIWALGQIGDERSIGILEKYYTGNIDRRCNRSEELSQLELKRAIGYIRGDVNVTTFFWRFGEGMKK